MHIDQPATQGLSILITDGLALGHLAQSQ